MKKLLDLQPATNQINELLYPVSLSPVFAVTDEGRCKKFSEETNRFKAIVNENTNEIVSVVSSNYKLLSNEEAVLRGKQVFKELFPGVKPDDLIPFKVISPKSLASCHIDFIHRDVKLSHDDWVQDIWFPFIRVSNSYNRSVAFKLEIGFVRELCSNGVIFRKDTLELKSYHDRDLRFTFDEKLEKLKQHENAFVQHLNRLKAIETDSKLVFDVVCNALNLSFDVVNKNSLIREKEIERQLKTKKIIEELVKGYFLEMDNTAYAVLNVLSDFVSHQSEYKCIPGFSINPDIYYKKVSDWMIDKSNG